LGLLASLGLAFGVLTFVVGDYLAPASERLGTQLRASFKGSMDIGRSGAWLKEKQHTAAGEHSYSIHVTSTDANGELQLVRLFEFDTHGRLVQRIQAQSATVNRDSVWTFNEATVTRWPHPEKMEPPPDGDATPKEPVLQTHTETLSTVNWSSTLSADVVAAAVMPLNTMSTVELGRYVAHLADNEQAAQRHEIQFWKRALYPLACLVMVGLALPFAYMHTRGGQGISLKVFGGIMLGISFVLLNNLASHLGLLQNWTPWMVAAVPSVFYLLLSMAAFTWLIRYR
jgi:lipopolysaccharide export system permease protein